MGDLFLYVSQGDGNSTSVIHLPVWINCVQHERKMTRVKSVRSTNGKRCLGFRLFLGRDDNNDGAFSFSFFKRCTDTRQV
ncbi:hypothetical protein PILCRDRAFT_821258 [Piloderma croceum F 1598]|uniref:Uncharacterized protein n=1 Tax=Piloderma croceum (strain F 1598) TaxID=765440 RepID=A0A0C3FQA8_PILCF|nr:hypothetical protein PILCRDRAFT_821258 [Piloderma croceum F 1598]